MSKKILIVEDIADVRVMMKILIECYGYETIVATDGYEAIEKVKQYHPDLILMDLMMPVLDGAVAVEIIRNLESGARIPIIATTAYSENFTRRALEAGCDDVISKPLDFDNLKPLLRHYLNN